TTLPVSCQAGWSCVASIVLSRAPATTLTYTLSLHDALPISVRRGVASPCRRAAPEPPGWGRTRRVRRTGPRVPAEPSSRRRAARSEEHTSELQSHLNLVCRLLPAKKKKRNVPARHRTTRRGR